MERSALPSLPPVDLDPAAFARVWRRVMPTDRPDCPFTLTPPEPEAPLPQLEALLADVLRLRRSRYALARRLGDPLWQTLAEDKSRQAAQLSAACYMLTGRKPHLPPEPIPRPLPMPDALRFHLCAEQRLADAFLDAAQCAADPGLTRLLLLLVECSRAGTRRLWDALVRRQRP